MLGKTPEQQGRPKRQRVASSTSSSPNSSSDVVILGSSDNVGTMAAPAFSASQDAVHDNLLTSPSGAPLDSMTFLSVQLTHGRRSTQSTFHSLHFHTQVTRRDERL
eukprot:TRINITY_DN4419_c0_g1_i3.p1 TRINITY_DN4419_c0_g1~~TRINITY_DN4419_c0_g1_i3.p1  ORF type:complete len:106 (-),score=16.22 TRINITY_DN4419_c0_g1_i3:639-956(-)